MRERTSGLVGGTVGAFLVLVGVGTLVGMPWRYAGAGASLAALQAVGALGAIGIGVGVGWMAVRGGQYRDGR